MSDAFDPKRLQALMSKVVGGYKEIAERNLKAGEYFEAWSKEQLAGMSAEDSAAASNYVTEEAGIWGLELEMSRWMDELEQLGISIPAPEINEDGTVASNA
jgi:hypothetical protein